MLTSAGRDLDDLATLEKRNRRSDRDQANNLLKHEKQVRESAATEIDAVRKDAAQWIERKQHLPQEVADMERDYKTVQSADLGGLAAAVQKAQADWPEKKADLDSRLASVNATKTRADQAWQSSAEARKAAAANDPAKVDYGALFGAADTLKTAAADLPKQSESLKTLTTQLYNSWDKLLVDLQVRDGGKYEQRIRTVRTHLNDASTKDGQTSSDENWVEVSRSQYQAMERDLGMAIEHKPAGKYDVESERVAQPAGFAYMAPPGQSDASLTMAKLLMAAARGTAPAAPPRRSATRAAPSPRAGASKIRNSLAGRAAIATRSTPRPAAIAPGSRSAGNQPRRRQRGRTNRLRHAPRCPAAVPAAASDDADRTGEISMKLAKHRSLTSTVS
jgi:hypothetical protein